MDLQIERVRAADEDAAIELLLQYDDKSYSLMGATSFAVMDRLGVSTGLTLNSDFRHQDYRTLGT